MTAAAAGAGADLVPAHRFLGEDTLTAGEFHHDLPRLQEKGVYVTAQAFIDRLERDPVGRAQRKAPGGDFACKARDRRAVVRLNESDTLGRES